MKTEAPKIKSIGLAFSDSTYCVIDKRYVLGVDLYGIVHNTIMTDNGELDVFQSCQDFKLTFSPDLRGSTFNRETKQPVDLSVSERIDGCDIICLFMDMDDNSRVGLFLPYRVNERSQKVTRSHESVCIECCN